VIDQWSSAYDGISVVAKMNDDLLEAQVPAKMSTSVVSGGGSGDTGVAGALAVNVQNTDSAAYTNQDATSVDGSIDVVSVNLSENSAQASPAKTAAGVPSGIGAAVAVNVAVNSSRAGVADEAPVTYLSAGGDIPTSVPGNLAPADYRPMRGPTDSGVNIRAASDHVVTTEAEAGAAGGTAVTPAVALSLVENTTQAGIGRAAGDAWLYVGADLLVVQAEAKESITTTAKGSSDGEKAAIGTAIALSW